MPESQIAAQPQANALRRMGVLLADPLRERIVTELYMREMSPSGFHAEFGGGSVPRVDRHFKRLAEHNWLTFTRSESGGRRRGGTEYFYRSTDLAVLDNETWSGIPHSVKVALSGRSFEQLTRQVRNAMQAGTFDARPERHLSWTPLLVDELGWERVVAAVDALFESLRDERASAQLRLAESGEQPILATIALSAFESPNRSGNAAAKQPIASAESAGPLAPLTLRLSKVFADPLCLKIVAETNLREISAAQFHAQAGEATLAGIRRRFKMLEEIGWLQKAGEKTGGKRRGATEYFYRATGPAIFEGDVWADVPHSVKSTYSWRTFEQLSEQVRVAIEAGTFDSRPDSHLSWWSLRLDQLGWEQVIARVDRLFRFAFEVKKDAEARLARSGERPITMTLALAAFESPKDVVKAP